LTGGVMSKDKAVDKVGEFRKWSKDCCTEVRSQVIRDVVRICETFLNGCNLDNVDTMNPYKLVKTLIEKFELLEVKQNDKNEKSKTT
jgi:hypothetical protein